MMSLLMLLLMFNLIFNFIMKNLMQLFYQNLIFIIIFIYMLNIPLNSMFFYIKIYYNLMMDYYSFGLVILSLWIVSLMLLSSNSIFKFSNYLLYMYIINMMLIFLILCFYSSSLIMFYMFFESSLIPVFLLILIWGYQVERVQAGVYLMLYTLFGSMPLFMMILFLYSKNFTLIFNFIKLNNINFLIYLFLILAFLIKMPMYLFHLWLPKAHVEAPVMGSMILAGVMLKLGSYGLMRVLLFMIEMDLKFSKFIIIISLMGGMFSSLICLCQIDMKMLVAYSSVVHMSLLMCGMLTMFSLGYYGSFLMMIAHGLCSSGMFCLVNINYERLNSRSLFINKGLINLFPSLSLMWFLLCSSNLSFPPSLNLWSEIMLVSSLIIWSSMIIFILIILMFFSACYTLYLYSYSQHGKLMKFYNLNIINISDFMLLLLHWLPLNMFFFVMIMFC